MNVTYNKLVQLEVCKICDYYDDCAHMLGDRFFAELMTTVDAIKRHPLRWPLIEKGSDKRKGQMKKFPYVIVYRVLDSSHFRVLVVKHQKRRSDLGMYRK